MYKIKNTSYKDRYNNILRFDQNIKRADTDDGEIQAADINPVATLLRTEYSIVLFCYFLKE